MNSLQEYDRHVQAELVQRHLAHPDRPFEEILEEVTEEFRPLFVELLRSHNPTLELV